MDTLALMRPGPKVHLDLASLSICTTRILQLPKLTMAIEWDTILVMAGPTVLKMICECPKAVLSISAHLVFSFTGDVVTANVTAPAAIVGDNLARLATVTASSWTDSQLPRAVVDGNTQGCKPRFWNS